MKGVGHNTWPTSPVSQTLQLRCTKTLNAGLADPAIKARLAETGTIPMILTASDFSAYVAAETEKWAKVVKFAGIRAE